MSSSRSRLLPLLAAAVTLLVTAVLTSAPPSSAAATLTADWQLQGNLTSTVTGVPALTNIGTGNRFVTTTVDGTAGRKVLSYPTTGGLKVSPTTNLVTAGVYSVVLLYKPTTLAGYQRLTDFDEGLSEVGLYTLNNRLVAYPNGFGDRTDLTTTGFHQVVLTRTKSKVVTGYVDGIQQFSFTDTGNSWLADGADIRFFKDNSSEDGAGQAARVRLYKTALTAAEVANLDRLPTVPTNTANLGVSLTDAPDPVKAGKLMAYTATVSNAGPSTAAATSLTLTLPAGATFVGSSPSTGTCAAPAGGKVTCTIGALANGASAQVLVVANAPSTTGSITGSVTVSSTTTDSATGNNTASSTTKVG